MSGKGELTRGPSYDPQQQGLASMDAKHERELVHKIRWAETAEEGMHLLDAALVAEAERVRRKTLEEAAKLVESSGCMTDKLIASAIRALAAKGK